MSFRIRLEERQRRVNSLLCVGLDPKVEKIPEHILRKHGDDVAAAFYEWMTYVVDTTAPFAGMYKLQIACYSAITFGEEALIRLIEYIKKNYPTIPIFLDAKRGDIGRTQLQYGKEVFDKYGADGSNVSPYMGSDCMSAWKDWSDRLRSC